jgi:hypothetical protein
MESNRPSATPLKNSAGADVAGGGEPPYYGGMEHRMTALETRLDTILPTLATKADMEGLRAEMEGLRAEMGGLRAEMGGLRVTTKADIEGLRAEIEIAGLRTDAKLAELRSDMHKMHADIKTWMLATVITMVGTMLAAIFGLSQIYKGAASAIPAHQAPMVTPAIPR